MDCLSAMSTADYDGDERVLEPASTIARVDSEIRRCSGYPTVLTNIIASYVLPVEWVEFHRLVVKPDAYCHGECYSRANHPMIDPCNLVIWSHPWLYPIPYDLTISIHSATSSLMIALYFMNELNAAITFTTTIGHLWDFVHLGYWWREITDPCKQVDLPELEHAHLVKIIRESILAWFTAKIENRMLQ